MNMPYTALLFDARDSVVRITLNRPDAANALNVDLARDLMHAALQCDEDPMIRAVIVTGAGRMFCAGGDLKSFAAQGENLAYHLKEVTTYLHAAMSRFTRMDAPVIAAVNGTAAGAGMSLACACDFVLAAESARFTMAYTRAGLTPDGSSTYFLPRIVGLKRALELTLTNRMLSAQEAQEWGIVTRVVPDANLLAEADTLAAQLAAGAPGALGAAKRLLHSGWTETLETQMELETRAIAARAHTADGREGIAAFLEKRAPQFKGK
ncbi:MAG: enoyl-CoA hydratase/isomerase family protein [Deltaproteobacteria bacterium]|nr:enoyl-CoA hydratase/isomerase family protein [Deltaproteobacteria bacterium]